MKTPLSGPLAFGMRATDLTYLVCAVHLTICVVLIVAATPGTGTGPARFGGTSTMHTMEVVGGAFSCVSIVSIIAAGVGTLYLIERHLVLYFYVLLLSACVDAAWIVLLTQRGQACKTLVADAEAARSSVACRSTSTLPLVCFALAGVFKLAGAMVVSKARKAVRTQYNEELLPHMRKSLQDAFGSINPESAGLFDSRAPSSQQQPYPFGAAATAASAGFLAQSQQPTAAPQAAAYPQYGATH